jgi:hypothetical protein
MQSSLSITLLVFGLLIVCSLVVDESEAILSLAGSKGKRKNKKIPREKPEKRLQSMLSYASHLRVREYTDKWTTTT